MQAAKLAEKQAEKEAKAAKLAAKQAAAAAQAAAKKEGGGGGDKKAAAKAAAEEKRVRGRAGRGGARRALAWGGSPPRCGVQAAASRECTRLRARAPLTRVPPARPGPAVAQQQEAEEAARLLAEVAAVPKGAKKDVSKAAGKTYNPRIVEATWWVSPVLVLGHLP